MRVRAAALVCLLAPAVTLSGCAGSVLRGAADPRPRDDGTQGRAAASCVGPYLDDQSPGGSFGPPPPTVAPGEAIELHGHFYTKTCNDTGRYEPLVALPDVRLTVTFPGGRQLELGPFTPNGRDMGFAATIRVPACAHAGTVIVTDDRDYPATYGFRVRR